MPHIASFGGSPIFPPLSVVFSFGLGLLFLLVLIFLFVHFRSKGLSFSHKIREFLIWAGFLFMVIGGFAAYIFLPSPKIVSVAPLQGSSGIDPKSSISILFDRPVGRRVMVKTITPDIPGVWVFEDPLYSTHLYRRVTFYPDTTLNAGASYMVKLSGIENTLQTSGPETYGFTFTTKSDPIVATAIAKEENQTVRLNVPAYLQQHTLSCEVASLRMALAYKGVNVTEDILLGQVGVDNTPHVDGTWGNPYEHFVGNVNGNQLKDGYGVYWGPIERVAKMYGNAQAFQNGNIQKLTQAIQAGNPVIVWVYSESGAPTHWKTPDGISVFAVAGEHTVVVVGYVGTPDNPTEIIVNDSLVGQSYWSRSLFDHKWATFSQSGVVIFK